MCTIKMIALDMDGTVLTDTKEITMYTKMVLEKAMEEGIIVLACTGRPSNAIPDVFANLKGIRYAISSNGARVLDVMNQQVMFEELVSVSDIRKILECSAKYDTYKEIFWDGQGYTSKSMFINLENYFNEHMINYIQKTRIAVENLEEKITEQNAPCDKLHIVFADMCERERFELELKSLGDFEYMGALLNNMEITAPGINKGTSIIRLGEILGIRREEIMAIGDGMNDASMLQEVGMPIAMGNAVEELKGIAKYITSSNNDDGVAKAIVKIALGGCTWE